MDEGSIPLAISISIPKNPYPPIVVGTGDSA